MAGHSHSANIASRKGAVDKKRAQAFSKFSRAIISAVRQGGAEVDHNLKLKYAIEKARAGNMPRDNIDRAIKRGLGEMGGVIEEINYEGYAPGGVAIIVSCLTDNRARTAPDVRHAFDRHGGSIGSPGSVTFLFSFRSIFVADREGKDEDAWTEIALDAGAEDVRVENDVVTIVAPPAEFLAAKARIEARGVKLLKAETGYVPNSTVAVADKPQAARLLKLIDALEENEDVQSVYANYEIPDEWILELEG